MFDGLRHEDDPGIPPLRPERLAAGGTISAPDVQLSPSIRMPGIAEWFAVAVLVLVGVGLLWVL